MVASVIDDGGSANSDNVRVVVRCRPLSETEVANGHESAVDIDEDAMTITVRSSELLPKTFAFDAIFGPASSQLDVYNRAARPIIENVLEGYNGTIFAYGQTGTGKTFTMAGDSTSPELRGITPNSFAHIFDRIAKSDQNKTFLVRVSYLEIYNEEVRDLLAKNQNQHLEIKERTDIGVYVKDLSSVTVGSADEMDKIMTLGNKNRSVGSTNMNAHSSRSHAIFTVTVECSEWGAADKKQHIRQGKLHLVDLAGSERQSKSGTSGQRLKEASKINLSLSTLGNVISALVDAKSTHIPYRNSKLTRLLQDSLGGNSKTVMIANIGPASYNYDETLSTLRYANRAKNIKNSAKINEDPKDALLRKFQLEIEQLRKQLAIDGDDYNDASSEGDDGDVQMDDGDGDNKRPKRRKNLSDEKMREIEAAIDVDRKKLAIEKDIDENERRRLEAELAKREHDLQMEKEEHDQLMEKLAKIEKKVIVGGENLLEKAEEQARLLEESNRELEQRRHKERQLRKAIEQKQAERIDMEEKYSSLQEEATGKTKKLRKCWSMLANARAELNDVQTEHQREMEGLLDSVRELSRELRLQMLIIDEFIPRDYQELIERYVSWNDEMGDWELKCIAYTGNNMRKRDAIESTFDMRKIEQMQFDNVYLSYLNETGSSVKTIDTSWHKSRLKSAKKERQAAQLKVLLN